MNRNEPARRHQARRHRQPDASLNHRRVTSALLVSAVLTITACGAKPDDVSTNGQPTRAADPLSAWQVYYDFTHPDFKQVGQPARTDPASAWQTYYDSTHPDFNRVGQPAGSDPVSAWQAYYDLTHPEPTPGQGAA
jgi:hypothetical protein